MKKQRLSVLVIVTMLFAAFTFGFFLGRNRDSYGILVSVPADMLTQPTAVTQPSSEPEETAAIITFPININTATVEEFMALPGIGEVLAARIVAYRSEHGNFSSVEGLMYVEGIGEKRMEDILDLITIGGYV